MKKIRSDSFLALFSILVLTFSVSCGGGEANGGSLEELLDLIPDTPETR